MPGLVPGIPLSEARCPPKRDGRDKPGHDANHQQAFTVNLAMSEAMSEDFLKNPLSLFDVRGKTAIVTGASGAFGALAAKVLAGAGANVVLSAGDAQALKNVAAECAS